MTDDGVRASARTPMIQGQFGMMIDTLTVFRAIQSLRLYADALADLDYDPRYVRQVITDLHDAYVAATGQQP